MILDIVRTGEDVAETVLCVVATQLRAIANYNPLGGTSLAESLACKFACSQSGQLSCIIIMIIIIIIILSEGFRQGATQLDN